MSDAPVTPPGGATGTDFARRIIAWQADQGRHDLPWQGTRDPYRIWISEIMLQQTQVAAVVPFYLRFMARFPTVLALAAAELDEVLAHWSGLGYYARARNLHAAARAVQERFAGRFPTASQELETLPGIGRSTAAAIAAFSVGERAAILDGNVKRVLARHFGIEGFPGARVVETRLWALAESLLPDRDIAAYTQGLMDLGATLCSRGAPRCPACPVHADCAARLAGRTADLPAPRPRRQRPRRRLTLWLLRAGEQVLLERRPPAGIWGGLWSLPERLPDALPREGLEHGPGFRLEHVFTHFVLDLVIEERHWGGGGEVAMPVLAQEDSARRWFEPDEALACGLPAPIRKVLESAVQAAFGITREPAAPEGDEPARTAAATLPTAALPADPAAPGT